MFLLFIPLRAPYSLARSAPMAPSMQSHSLVAPAAPPTMAQSPPRQKLPEILSGGFARVSPLKGWIRGPLKAIRILNICWVFSIYFSLLIIVIDVILITSLKGISRIIYNYINIENIPLLGIGKRPGGAMYCGSFVDENNIGQLIVI